MTLDVDHGLAELDVDHALAEADAFDEHLARARTSARSPGSR